MLRTLRGRLTALATVTTLVVSAVVCATLYLGIRYSLYDEVDAFLAGEVSEFRAMLAGDENLDDVQQRIRAELGSRRRGDLTFRLLDAQGRVLLTSDPANRLPDRWPVPPRPTSEMLLRTESGTAPGAQIRTCSYWTESNGGPPRIIQATYRLDQVNASLSRFARICAGALVVAAFLAAIGGRIAATRGLRPLGDVTGAARRITVENLSEQLRRTHLGDELDQLAETFNGMLERLEAQVTQLRQFTADAAH